ncbi:unnamed protein product [Prorocentrum cordatum]|uniref:Signal recognition particle SRP54 subunit M-domain domain-containing protein n=1 Tax=Prorocentrum cordatum TaxID=2364126 RepID=A0ABN9Q4L9_9DINO|nr:unnamed protein product [Polarella glacialis]
MALGAETGLRRRQTDRLPLFNPPAPALASASAAVTAMAVAAVAVGAAAAWAAVSCFALGGLRPRRAGAAAEARAPRRASNPLEARDHLGAAAEAGAKFLDASASAVTGMSTQDRAGRAHGQDDGRTDFNDYVKMTMLLKNKGGIGGLATTLSSVQGLDKLEGAMGMAQGDESEKKLETYCTIISAMTPEDQRESPGMFIFSEAKEENIQGLIKASEVPEETVRAFLGEFESMRFVFLKLGAGMREGKSHDKIAKEIDQESWRGRRRRSTMRRRARRST